MNRGAFVFTGMTFLLVIPTMILATSYVNMVKYGEGAWTIGVEADKVYHIALDLKETIIDSAQDSGRYNAYLATQNIIGTYERLTNEESIEYAVEHSWYTDPEISSDSSCKVIEDNIRSSINNALAEITSNYSATLIVNNGLNVTDATITMSQTDPWGFTVYISPLSLTVDDGSTTYETTIPSVEVYISIEDLQDPYVFVKTRGRRTNRITRTIYTPPDVRYNETIDTENHRLNQLYNALVGPGTESSPLPYYYNHTSGLSFFDRLDGGGPTVCSDNQTTIETFIIGDPLGDRTAASRIDHSYFNNVNGSPITICGVPFTDPKGNTLFIDDTHLGYYDLGTSYLCEGVDLTLASFDISFTPSLAGVGDSVTIDAIIHNSGTEDANSVKVQFFDGDPDAGGTQIGVNKTIGSITGGGTGSTSVSWTATGGTSSIYVRIDPDDSIDEINENNNKASADICINTDLSVLISTPLSGFVTDNCPSTTTYINASINDNCGNPLAGSNATASADISTDGAVGMSDPETDGVYWGLWGPSATGNPLVNVTAMGGAGTPWEGLSGSSSVNGTVDNCVVTNVADVAIFVPQVQSYIGVSEQENIASYLMSNLVAKSIARYVYSNQSSLDSWMSTNLADGEVDIVVILDAAPYDMYHGENDGSDAESWLENGNMIIYTGYPPFYRYIYSSGVQSTSGAGWYGCSDIFDVSSNTFFCSVWRSQTTITSASSNYLPTLASGGSWWGYSMRYYYFTMDRYYTSSGEWYPDTIFAEYYPWRSSNALLLRHKNGGLFLNLYTRSQDSLPRAEVIEEFIENWLETHPGVYFERRVNSADNYYRRWYTDSNGKSWAADQSYGSGGWGYVGGTQISTGSPIANTGEDPLYQRAREGSSATLEYRFDLPNGDYDVDLHFAEIRSQVNDADDRKFDVAIEGTSVLTAYSIYSDTGGRYSAVTKSFTATVSDGTLNIVFTKNGGTYNPLINAIHVVRSGYG